MAKFGWAYVNCSSSTDGGQGAGPTGSVQFLTGTNATSGSKNLMYHTAAVSVYTANTMVLTGTLIVTGTISASVFHVEDIAVIDATGSTYFGDTNDDVHIRTGSLAVGAVGAGSTLLTNATTNVVTVAGFKGAYKAGNTLTVATAVNDYVIGVSSSQAVGGGDSNVEVQLHSASTAGAGAFILIKDEVLNRSTTRIIVSASVPAGGFSIDGQPYFELTGTMPAISLYSNGSNWFVF